MSGFIHFAIGGSRSGKSRRAESLAIATGQAVAYLATYAADPPDVAGGFLVLVSFIFYLHSP